MEDAQIALYYRLFFLYIEPVSALVGSFYAGRPREYLSLLTLGKTPLTIPFVPKEVEIALYQLSNLYLLFALNEALVLRSTNNLATWRTLLFCLLVADFGHLATNIPLGLGAFWKIGQWNAMMWGGVAFVYAGALSRIAFLLGIGVSIEKAKKA